MPSHSGSPNPATESKRLVSIASQHRSGNRTSSSSYKDDCKLLDLSSYTKMRMERQKDSMVVVAQAMVTMEDLVNFTLPHGCIPKVVAEFKHITVGGAISGASLESTSHAHGQFMDTVEWVEVRLGNGEKKVAIRGDDLWCAVSGTYGTIAIILEAAIECLPATPHVQVSYYCFDSVELLTDALVRSRDEDCFLEGLQLPNEYGPPLEGGKGVLMKGRMVGSTAKDEKRTKLGWKSPNPGGPFYYEHVIDLLGDHLAASRRRRSHDSCSQPFHEEVIPTIDYLFRYDPGAFWMARPMAFEWSKLLSYFPFTIGLFVASHRWIRLLTGYCFTTRRLFGWLQKAPQAVIASNMIIQDLYLPSAEAAASLVTWVRQNVPLSTPIWLCPVKSNSNQPWTPSYSKKGTAFLNCGIYGRVPNGNGRNYTQWLEMQCQTRGGRKMLYAQNYYSSHDFWTLYDETHYDRARKQLHAEDAFPDLVRKTCAPIPERTNSWTEWIVSLLL